MTTASYRAPKLLINGQWREGRHKARHTIINPANAQILDDLTLANEVDLNDALNASQAAFTVWRQTNAHERCEHLENGVRAMRENVERIALLLTLEQGKPLAEARAECQMAAGLIKWYAEEARRTYGRIIPARLPNSRMEVQKHPVGPVAAFSPWNFPLVLSARKLGGALAAGCSIILKAAEETPASVAAMVECLNQALPAGVLQLVYGIPAEVSHSLIKSPLIRKVSFTGSVPVGRILAGLAAQNMKRITLELGGHAPVIVCDDADLQRAVTLLVTQKFRNAGQACLAPTRFFIARSRYAEFIEAFQAASLSLKMGSGTAHGTQMGPVANERRKAALQDLINRSVAAGAKCLSSAAPEEGCFIAPTILVNVTPNTPIMQEEPFGPIACMSPFDTLDEAISRANQNAYGLAGYLFTDSASRIHAVAQKLEVGSLAINSINVSVPEAPFGGVKDSGYGSESGVEGMAAYLDSKFLHYVS
tara:strand:- start:69268 stop:70701 length:1434 start_codon:yes stop_codon:yes gene_type:complete